MTYVISDIHGRIDLFEKMLAQINLKKEDKLYVLGDCIDRGGGLEVALKLSELKKKGLVEFIFGNHELVFLINHDYHKSNKEIAKDLLEIEKIKIKSKLLSKKQKNYQENPNIGSLVGSVCNLFKSVNNFDDLGHYQDEIHKSLLSVVQCARYEEWETWDSLNSLSEDQINDIINFFMQEVVSFKKVDVGEKHYFLVHGGITDDSYGNMFVREEFYMKPVNKELLKKYKADENSIVIFGHTTTRDINIEVNGTYIAPNKIWYDTIYNDKIGIDCGASYPNGQLACLRLDDMKEFYVKNEDRFIVRPEKLTKKFNEPRMIFSKYYSDIADVFSDNTIV